MSSTPASETLPVRPRFRSWWPAWLCLAVAWGLALAFPLLGNALRWPARIGGAMAVIAALAWLARSWRAVVADRRTLVREALFSVVALAALGIASHFLRPTWDLWRYQRAQPKAAIQHPSAGASVAHLKTLSEALAARGVELVVLAMPYRDHLEKRSLAGSNPVLRPTRESAVARQALAALRDAGIPAIDLWNAFNREVREPSDWDTDGCHLADEALERVAGRLRATVEGALTPPDGRPLLMGECFARQFGEILRTGGAPWSELRIVHTLGDRGKVADQLFLFPRENLEGTGRVYWLMSYRLLTQPAFPPLRTEPGSGGESLTVTLRIASSPGWSREEDEADLKRLPYADALVELEATVVEPAAGVPERLVAIGPGIVDRRLEPLGRISTGNQMHAILVPWDEHLRKDPKAANAYVGHAAADFSLPRYWIAEWTYANPADRPE